MNAEEIVEGLRSSNAQAWEELHRQYWPRVLAVVSRKFPDLVSPDIARDVTSETLMAVARQVQRGIEVQPDNLRAYVMKIAQRKGLEAVLKRRKDTLEADAILRDRLQDGCRYNYAYRAEQDPPRLELACSRPNPEQALLSSRKTQRMQQAIAHLRQSDRDILQRFYYGGETKEEIMAAYAITEDQFRLCKSRALTRLMAYLYGLPSAMKNEAGRMYRRAELRERGTLSQH